MDKNILTKTSTCNGAFLKVAVDKLLVYRTPKKVVDFIKKEIVDFIKKEETKCIIGNPPYNVKR